MGSLTRSTHNFASGLIAEENLLLDQSNPKSKIGWVSYDDSTVNGKPVDGTGGSPSAVSVGYALTAASSVAGITLQKSGVSGEGEGISYNFTVPTYLRTKVLTIAFDYNVITNNITDGFFGVFIYDVDNATLIEPANVSLGGLVVGAEGQHLAQFQTSATGTNYRFIIHCATNSTTATTLRVGNLTIGRNKVNTAVSSNAGQRLVAEQRTAPAAQSIPTAIFTTVDFPNQVQSTTGGWVTGAGYNSGTGTWTTEPGWVAQESGTYNVQSGIRFANAVFTVGSTFTFSVAVNGTIIKVLASDEQDATNTTSIGLAGSCLLLLNAGDFVTMKAFQNEGANRSTEANAVFDYLDISKVQGPQTHALPEFVGVRASQNSGQLVANGGTATVIFNIEDYDTHNAYNNLTGVFTAPVDGYYSLESTVTSICNVVNTNQIEYRCRVNGTIVSSSIFEYLATNNAATHSLNTSTAERLSAGDTVDFVLAPTINSGSANIIGPSYRNILKIEKVG